MILAIVFAVLAYQRAKASGRNGWLWAFLAIGVYVGVQLVIGLAVGFGLGVGVAAFGWPESVFTDYEIVINIVAIVFAVAASWLMLKYLDRMPEEAPIGMAPPPPPSFTSAEPPSDRAD